jgi:hypothetical protein
MRLFFFDFFAKNQKKTNASLSKGSFLTRLFNRVYFYPTT